MKRLFLAIAVTLTAAGAAVAASADWRQNIHREDQRRLARLDNAWSQALQQAGRGHRTELRSLGRVVDPAAGLARPEPTPGTYRCRTIKVGSPPSVDGLGLVTYGWFRCRVTLTPEGDLRLEKTTGSQRTMGNLYPDTRRRLVYLGAVAWGNEGVAVYGRDPERDQVGVVERIGPQQWRLVLPYPKQESTLDILELRR